MEFLVSPVEMLGDDDGHVRAVKFVRNRLGEPDATGPPRAGAHRGQRVRDRGRHGHPCRQPGRRQHLPARRVEFEINRGRVRVDPGTYATNVRGVFACGDFVTGPTTLIEAAGHGKKCAYAIDRYLSGRREVDVDANVRIVSSWRHEMPDYYDVLPRVHVPMAAVTARMPSADPHGQLHHSGRARLYDAQQAVTEGTRCLMCNYNIWFDPYRCVLCGACADVCPEGVIHMIDINQMKSEGALPELVDAYGWSDGAAMVLDEERCIRCALCVKRCPYDAITMERFELQEISSDGRLYKESYRDTQLGLAGVGNQRDCGRLRSLSFLERVDTAVQAERRLPLAVPPAVSERRAIALLRGHEQRLPAPAPGARPPARGQVRLHLLPRRPVVLLLPRADRDRRLPDVLLRAVVDAGLRRHPAHPGRGAIRAADAQHPSLGSAPDGLLRLPAHDARLLPRRLQAAARVQLGRRRAAALLHRRPVVHRLPVAVGPDRLLGDHHRQQHRLVLPARLAARPAADLRRHRGQSEHAAALLRAARDPLTA